MSVSRDAVLASFWKPEMNNAWELCFEKLQGRARATIDVLLLLPRELGQIEFCNALDGDGLVVLFAHDLENREARRNEARILLTLVETHALTFFGVEGASGPLNVAPHRSLSNRAVSSDVALHLLDRFMLSPIEFVAIACRDPIDALGIEDFDLYSRALQAYQSSAAGYWDLIEQRAPVLSSNLIGAMEERGVPVAGMCVTDYNYWKAQSWFEEAGISQVGVRSLSAGASEVGRLDASLRAEPYDEEEAALWEMFGVSPTRQERRKR